MNHVSSHNFICTKIDTSSASISGFPAQKSLSFGDIRTQGCFKDGCWWGQQGVPVLKCPRSRAGWELSCEVGRQDNWQRACSPSSPGWVPMLAFLLGSRQGSPPAPGHPMSGCRNGTEMEYVRPELWQVAGLGPDCSACSRGTWCSGNGGSWKMALQGKEYSMRIKYVDSLLPCQSWVRRGLD